jgi:hypothetical protein
MMTSSVGNVRHHHHPLHLYRLFCFKNVHFTHCIKQEIRVKVQRDYIPLTRLVNSHNYSPNRVDRSINRVLHHWSASWTIQSTKATAVMERFRNTAVLLEPDTPSYQEDQRVQSFPSVFRRKLGTAKAPVDGYIARSRSKALPTKPLQHLEQNLPAVQTLQQKMIEPFRLLWTQSTQTIVPQPVSLQPLRCPTTTQEHQPNVEPTFIWCPDLPQLFRSRDGMLPSEQRRVRRASRETAWGTPAPLQPVRDDPVKCYIPQPLPNFKILNQ